MRGVRFYGPALVALLLLATVVVKALTADCDAGDMLLDIADLPQDGCEPGVLGHIGEFLHDPPLGTVDWILLATGALILTRQSALFFARTRVGVVEIGAIEDHTAPAAPSSNAPEPDVEAEGPGIDAAAEPAPDEPAPAAAAAAPVDAGVGMRIKATLQELGIPEAPTVPGGAVRGAKVVVEEPTLQRAWAILELLMVGWDWVRPKTGYRVTGMIEPGSKECAEGPPAPPGDEDAREHQGEEAEAAPASGTDDSEAEAPTSSACCLTVEVRSRYDGRILDIHGVAGESRAEAAHEAAYRIYKTVAARQESVRGTPLWAIWASRSPLPLRLFREGLKVERRAKERQDWEAAADLFEGAAEHEPTNAIVSLRQGNAHERGENPQAALRAYLKVVAAWPELITARYRLAVIYATLIDPEAQSRINEGDGGVHDEDELWALMTRTARHGSRKYARLERTFKELYRHLADRQWEILERQLRWPTLAWQWVGVDAPTSWRPGWRRDRAPFARPFPSGATRRAFKNAVQMAKYVTMLQEQPESGDVGRELTPAEKEAEAWVTEKVSPTGLSLFMLFWAVQRLAADGRLPVRVSFLIDGEEESGGTSAIDHIEADSEAARAAIIFDAPMVGPEQPAFYTGLRGMTFVKLHVRTGTSEAHSGLFGGAAQNAAHTLLQILATVTPRNGRPPEELQAGVVAPTDEEVQAWDLLAPGDTVLAEAGLAPADAEAGREFYRRTLALPAVDIHAIQCGPPSMDQAVVPVTATATLSARLAPGQQVDRITDVLEATLVEAAPPGADVSLERLGTAEPALVDPHDPALERAVRGMQEAIGWRPVPARIGGSIPVVAALARRGIPTVLSGFYLAEDGIHAPNERIGVEHLTRGTRAAAGIIAAQG